jgi:hypothetical protein
VAKKPTTNQAAATKSPTGSTISTIDEPDNADDIDSELENAIKSKYWSVWSMKEMAGVFDLTPTVENVMQVLQDRQRGINLDVEEACEALESAHWCPECKQLFAVDSKFRSHKSIFHRMDHDEKPLC